MAGPDVRFVFPLPYILLDDNDGLILIELRFSHQRSLASRTFLPSCLIT